MWEIRTSSVGNGFGQVAVSPGDLSFVVSPPLTHLLLTHSLNSTRLTHSPTTHSLNRQCGRRHKAVDTSRLLALGAF